MLKRTIITLLTAAMIFSSVVSVSAKEEANIGQNAFSESDSIKIDFKNDDAEFIPIFADYPAEENTDKFYEFDYGWRNIPIDNAGKGLFISGNNHSDDLFMGYYKELNGFTPNKSYTVNISFKLATDVDGGQMGIGGSPGSSVYVKCGIVSQKPKAEVADLNDYRLNIDKGNQATDGEDMKTVGTIEKKETLLPEKYEFNEYNASLEMTADEKGNAYLIIGTDSGFEGVTSYYISDIELQLKSKNNCSYSEKFEQYIKDAISVGIIEDENYAWKEASTRLQFCEFAYNMINSVKELPVAKLSRCPFDDINNPKINALTFVGIINGKDEYIFAPEDKITREEAAVILRRIAEYAEFEMPEVNVDMSYSDNSEISEWAIPSVYSLKVLDVMMNKSNASFEPKTNYTVEEAVYSLIKIYNHVK